MTSGFRATKVARTLDELEAAGGGMVSLPCGILRPKLLYFLDELPESQATSTPPEQTPPMGGRDRGMHLF